jgi:hypothetical protein
MGRSQSKSFFGPRCFRGNAWGPIARPLVTSCDCRTAKLQPEHGAMILLTSASRVPARSGQPFSRCFLGTSLLFSRAANGGSRFLLRRQSCVGHCRSQECTCGPPNMSLYFITDPRNHIQPGFCGRSRQRPGCEFLEKCIRPMRSRLFSARVFDFDPLIRSRSPCRCRELRAF